MKKILTALAITALTVSPAMAHQREQEHHHHKNRWVAPLLGGIILGAIISNNKQDDNRQVEEYPRYYTNPPTTYQYIPTCWYEDRMDYYGVVRTYRVCR